MYKYTDWNETSDKLHDVRAELTVFVQQKLKNEKVKPYKKLLLTLSKEVIDRAQFNMSTTCWEIFHQKNSTETQRKLLKLYTQTEVDSVKAIETLYPDIKNLSLKYQELIEKLRRIMSKQ